MGKLATAALILLLVSRLAQAFVDTPILVPTAPAAGQPVSVSITAGACDLFSPDGSTVTRSGNDIHLIAQSGHSDDLEFCTFPTLTTMYLLGTFPPGSYTVQVDRQYLGNNGLITESLATLSFAIAAIVTTPTLGAEGLLLLFSLLLIVSARALGQRRLYVPLLLLSALLPVASRAQVPGPVPQPPPGLEVLLSGKSGSPTPDQVIAYFSTANYKSTTPPLQSLTVEAPTGASYLLPVRAQGDFATYLQNNPNLVRAKLERYVVVQYPRGANLQNAIAAFKSDLNVDAVYKQATSARFSSVTLGGFGVSTSPAGPISSGPQYGRDDLNTDAAWQIASGYALIGDVDTGLYTAHSALAQFATNGTYLGGNFVTANSLNIGYANTPGYSSTWSDPNVDELYPLPLPSNSVCNPNHLAAVPPTYAGHGTHVAGLIAANPTNSFGVKGTCKNCGIAEWKVDYAICGSDGKVYPFFNPSVIGAAITYLSDTGAQIINLSLGDQSKAGDYCASNPTDTWCAAITYAGYRDVTLVASAGNNRLDMQFPANDSRVLDAGGFQQSLTIWDLSPGTNTNCPSTSLTGEPAGYECGSDYTVTSGKPQQEVMASANQVLSTTYPGLNWDLYSCGDGYPGPGWGNGKGLCTGTSMSAPQISGVVGILRSINPLVTTSAPIPGAGQAVGIRTVLASTTSEAQSNIGWTSTFGYGHPDAAAAAKAMLGAVAGRKVINRVTPLFRLYSSTAQDYADTTSPQFATALMISGALAYQPQGSATPGYAAFPSHEPGQPVLPAPKANVYVLTTEYTPWSNYPSMVPLYLMDRARNWPSGCTTGSPGCNSNNHDFILVTTTTDIQQAHTAGFNLRTIQGYVYHTCSPEPSCIPLGAQKFYRECKTSIDDCATFLESERTTFEANGYTSAYPSTSSKVLGYAYPNIDFDGDGLVDGMEYVIGTNPLIANSDGTGSVDGVAYPQAGVPVSDPCLGAGAINCPANFIFQNGFQ